MKIGDNDQWVQDQFEGCDLGNRLRTKRLMRVAGAMLSAPEQSLPKQMEAWADLKAAYRLFDQERVTFDGVAGFHWMQTREAARGRCLLISDTTDIDHFSHPATTGLSQLGKGDGWGMQLHNCLVYSTDQQQIIGNAGALIHYRPVVKKNETRTQRLQRNRESEIWGQVVEQVGPSAKDAQWIHVFDRGGDNFEAMCRIRLTGNDWIIRAAKLNRKVITADGTTIPLKKAVEQNELLGTYELALRSRRGVKARTATLEVSKVNVTLPTPRHRSEWLKSCSIKELNINVVIVQEINAPKRVTPIRWVLFTSLEVQSFDDAWQVIEDYEHRWLAEEYHKVLKTGCSIEMHALRTADRLEPLIALITVIGIRLLQTKYLGRSQPTARAKSHVPKSWLKCLKLARPKLKTTDMTVYTFFRELAKMGGFLGRKHDGEPGWQTIWHGYKKMHMLLDGMRLAGAI